MAAEMEYGGNIAVDRCWTLLPLSALSAMLTMIIPKNTALFYVACMDEFGVSHQDAIWPLTIHAMMAELAGILVAVMQQKVSIYNVAVLGSTLNFGAMVASAFVPNIIWMSVVLGIVGGAATGMIMIPLSIYAMLYFDKYRGVASSFKYTGMTLAPLAFPHILSALITAFGLRGTLLLLSAVTLNTLPVAILMNNPRPVELSCVKKCCWRGTKYGNDSQTDGITAMPGYSEGHILPISKAYAGEMSLFKTSKIRTRNSNMPEERRTAEPRAIICISHFFLQWDADEELHSGNCTSIRSQNKQSDLTAPTPALALPSTIVLDVSVSELSQRKNKPGSDEVDSTASARKGTGSENLPSSRSYGSGILQVLKRPLLYVLVVTITVGEYVLNTFETTVLDSGMDKGFSRAEAAPIITYLAAAELVGRLLIPFLWDLAKLRRSFLVALCLAVEAASLALMPFASTFGHFAATTVATAFPSGCVMALKPALLSDHFGVEMLPVCLGISGVAMLPTCFGGPLLIGLFLDIMGSYNELYHTLSAVCAALAVTMLAVAFYEIRAERHRKNQAKVAPILTSNTIVERF
ncbi:monocarboxylate transporter 7-like [Haemaphysalis longicornis]